MSNLTQRQKLAKLINEFAEHESAYFEFKHYTGWSKTSSSPTIKNILDNWRVVFPHRRKVEQAYKNGAEIEYRPIGFNRWDITKSPEWNWKVMEYRIKEPAKPIVRWLCILDNGLEIFAKSKEALSSHNGKLIKLVEGKSISCDEAFELGRTSVMDDLKKLEEDTRKYKGIFIDSGNRFQFGQDNRKGHNIAISKTLLGLVEQND